MSRLVHCIAVSVLILAAPALAADWPHIRGPRLDGSLEAPGAIGADPIGLETAWRLPLGSGYSGIAIAGSRAVTLHAAEGANWVSAFETATGKRAWRHRLGEMTKGHDGSHDGPLSSPVIADGLVHVLDPTGLLVALKLADGEVAWTRKLEADFEAKPPHFGFTTTPLVAEGLLILQAGGAGGRSVVGLDAASGETVWQRGDDRVDYQSPAVMTLAGQRQVVAIAGKRIVGLAPKDGAELWDVELGVGQRASSAQPTAIGDDRFLAHVGEGAIAYRVTRTEGGLAAEKLYETQALGNSYSAPVYREGHVYGFRGQVLTCMDAATGERVWRSREPGGDGLIAVDGNLVVFGARGYVVIAEATPEGYRERARAQALDGSSLTWPSFADGRVFVRNTDEIAAIAIRPKTAPSATSAPVPARHAFGAWLAGLGEAADPQGKVAAYFAEHRRTPIVEGRHVHFVWRGEATDVAISGSMNDTEKPEPLGRFPGTDLFYRTYELDPRVRWEYRFQIDYEDWMPDPGNPRQVPAGEGDATLSELLPAGREEAAHLAEPKGPRGRLDSFTLKSEILGYDKEIRVWLPPGHDAADGRRYPLLVVNDGKEWLDKGLITNTLDNLAGRTVEPLVVAFIPQAPQWWLEAGGSRIDDYVRMQIDELLPALEQRYRLADGPASRAVMGITFYGFPAIYTALKHPDVFGGVALQSIYTGLGNDHLLTALIDEGAGSSARIYFDWNLADVRNIDRDWDFADDSRALSDRLRRNGYDVSGGEVVDSYGWGGWRSRTDRMLMTLFPRSAAIAR